MADNITLNSGTGGSTLKTDDDGTAHWQEVKVAFGGDGTQTRVTTSDPLPVLSQGNSAHDAADGGAPVKIGFKAESSPKGITLVADGDRTNGYADLDGIQLVKLDTANADIINERVSNTNGTSTAFTNFSAVASTYNLIKTVVIHNAHASTNGYVDIRDGAAGTVLATIPAPATGGAVVNFDPPLRSSANTAMAYDVSAAITTVYITATGWQSKA